MAATRTRETRLSDEDVAKVMGLIKGSDSVELKLTVPETEHSGTVAALEMDPLNAEIRQVFFFDTPGADAVPARRRRARPPGPRRRATTPSSSCDPSSPSQLPGRVRKLPEFGVEVDAIAGGFCLLGLDERDTGTGVRARTIMGQRRGKRSSFRRRNGPSTPSTPRRGSSSTTSRFSVRSSCSSSSSRRRRSTLVAEMWLYPDGSRILELSTKCAPGEASKSQRRRGRSWQERASTSAASRRRRPARPSSSSPSGCRPQPRSPAPPDHLFTGPRGPEERRPPAPVGDRRGTPTKLVVLVEGCSSP